MAQVHSFGQGSFVAHRVAVSSYETKLTRISIWFTGNELTDAQGQDELGRYRQIKKGSRLWRILAGRIPRLIQQWEDENHA